MALLTYSTKIAVEKTVSEMTSKLGKAGARFVTTELGKDGQPIALEFAIETKSGERWFRLPANTDAVLRVLGRQQRDGRIPRRLVTRDQAARVGWRILREWLLAQLAIIETEMVALDEVMLPWMVVADNRTVYQALSASRFMLGAAQ